MLRGAICVVLAISVVGCGSSDTGSGNEPAQESAAATTAKAKPKKPEGLSHAVLLSRINAICDDANKAIKPVNKRVQEADEAGDLPGAAKVLQEGIDQGRKYDSRLYALRAEPADRETLAAYVQSVRRQGGYERRIVQAGLANNREGVIQLVGVMKANTRKRVTAAVDLGADRCGQP